jgi:hypothetical protein
MIKRISFSLALVAAATFSLAAAPAAAPTRVAVLEFNVKGDIGLKDAGSVAAEWLSSALTESSSFQVLERVLLDKVLEEQSIQVSGMIDESTSSKIGQLFGAQAIVTGSLVAWNQTVTLTAHVVDVGTGAVLRSATCRASDLNGLEARMGDLAKVLDGSLPPESLARSDEVPGSKKRDDQAVSVVKVTEKGGRLRLVIDRGELDKVANGQAFAVMLPEYGTSEVSGSRVRTGWKRAGVMVVSYVEPNYAAGDFLPELFSGAKPAAFVREAIALQTTPMNLTIFLGMLNVGGTFGQGFGGRNGIFSYFAAYESSQPGLSLANAGGELLGFSYERPILGNAFSRSRATVGLAALGRLGVSGPTSLTLGAGGASFVGITINGFKAQLGASAMHAFPFLGSSPSSINTIEPFVVLGYEFSLFGGR